MLKQDLYKIIYVALEIVTLLIVFENKKSVGCVRQTIKFAHLPKKGLFS